MSIAAYRGGSALSKKRAKIHMTTARRAESIWHLYKLRHSAAAAIRRGQDLAAFAPAPPGPKCRERLEFLSFSGPIRACGPRWISVLAITIAEQTAGHPHKFPTNHGEGRAAGGGSIDRDMGCRKLARGCRWRGPVRPCLEVGIRGGSYSMRGADGMAQETRDIKEAGRGLDAIAGAARAAASKGTPPVHLWNPPFCGDLDMRIAADGTWYYLKTPIGRAALVKLFASVLRREGDKYFLVTPVEKCGIAVDDAPFLAVELEREGGGPAQVLHFRTNVDDWVACGRDHALRFEQEPPPGGLKPYLHVRRGLWAKVTRALFYDLVELGEEREVAGRRMFGVASGGEFFTMAPADNLKDLF
jgi:hypothetical protein